MSGAQNQSSLDDKMKNLILVGKLTVVFRAYPVGVVVYETEALYKSQTSSCVFIWLVKLKQMQK